jgi:hypothetical protein
MLTNPLHFFLFDFFFFLFLSLIPSKMGGKPEIAALSKGLISLSQERQVRPQENGKNRKDRF